MLSSSYIFDFLRRGLWSNKSLMFDVMQFDVVQFDAIYYTRYVINEW